MGNLTRDPELRFTSQGTAVASFGLAVHRKFKQGKEWKDDVCFVDIAVWAKQGENCEQYLSKGSLVLVEGRLNYRTWEAEGGQKRSKLEVVANNVQILSNSESRYKLGNSDWYFEPIQLFSSIGIAKRMGFDSIDEMPREQAADGAKEYIVKGLTPEKVKSLFNNPAMSLEETEGKSLQVMYKTDEVSEWHVIGFVTAGDASIVLDDSDIDEILELARSGKIKKMDGWQPISEKNEGSRDSKRGNEGFRDSKRGDVDFHKAFGGDGIRDVYMGDGISIRPDGSYYDDR